MSYTWDCGDGEIRTETDAVTSHIYTSAGTYTVTLTVADANLQQDTDTTTANITDVVPPMPPEAVIDVDLILKTGECYRFDGSDSSDPNSSYNPHPFPPF